MKSSFTYVTSIRIALTRIANLCIDSIFFLRPNPDPRYYQSKVLVVASDLDRQVEINSHRYCQHLDPIFSNYNNILCVARFEYRQSIQNAPYTVLAYPRLFAMSQIIKGMLSILNTLQGRKIYHPRISFFEIYIWRSIFKAYNPVLILSICASREMCIASHAQSIPVIEFAHSEINQLDRKYSNAYRSRSQTNQNADWYFVWSKSSKHLIEKWHPSRQIIVGTTPSFLLNTKSTISNSDLPIGLVTLQYGINHSHPGFIRPELLKFVIESKGLVEWVFMPHPNHRYYHNISLIKSSLSSYDLSPNVVCCDPSPHLPSYLKHASFHITEYSGSAMESLALNIKTFVLNENFYNEILDNHPGYSDILKLGLPDLELIQNLPKTQIANQSGPDPGLIELKDIISKYADLEFSF